MKRHNSCGPPHPIKLYFKSFWTGPRNRQIRTRYQRRTNIVINHRGQNLDTYGDIQNSVLTIWITSIHDVSIYLPHPCEMATYEMELSCGIPRNPGTQHEEAHWAIFLIVATLGGSTKRMSSALETQGAMETFPCRLHFTKYCTYAVETCGCTVNNTY